MPLRRLLSFACLLSAVACNKAPPPEMTAAPLPAAAAQPAAPAGVAEAASPTAPPAGPLPAGHPPINGAAMPGNSPEAAVDFAVPAEWKEVPPRPMLTKLYLLPKGATETDAGEVTISSLGPGIALPMNVTRWCGQFDLAPGATCDTAAKLTPVQGAPLPTTLVEIEGAWRGSMGDAAGAGPKAGWKMAVAAVSAPDKTWYFKMVGPAAQVQQWLPALLAAAKSAK